MNKITEQTIQAILMNWLMNIKNHIFVLPNATVFFHSIGWESDLISVTKSMLTHEYEIKTNIHDYRRDEKKWKHKFIGEMDRAPAYFWYVTFGFEIVPPEKAGWLSVDYDNGTHMWKVTERKKAPRLNKWKIDNNKVRDIARLLSWRLTNVYRKYLFPEIMEA